MQKAKTGRTHRRSGVGTGTTSLLMIFTVLCFATLAMLSLSTAASNDRIQNRGLRGSKALSEARGAAAIEVASLDETLLQLQQEGTKDYKEEAFEAAEIRGWVADRDAGTVSIRLRVDEERVLTTRLLLLEPLAEARYEVQSQITELVNGWAPEEDGQLWQPV